MAGNSNSGRRSGGKDFSPRVRSLVDQVLEKMQESGDARKLLEAQFTEDFAGTLRAVAAFAPKQVDMAIDQQISIDTTQLSREVVEALYGLEEPSEHNEKPTSAVH